MLSRRSIHPFWVSAVLCALILATLPILALVHAEDQQLPRARILTEQDETPSTNRRARPTITRQSSSKSTFVDESITDSKSDLIQQTSPQDFQTQSNPESSASGPPSAERSLTVPPAPIPYESEPIDESGTIESDLNRDESTAPIPGHLSTEDASEAVQPLVIPSQEPQIIEATIDDDDSDEIDESGVGDSWTSWIIGGDDRIGAFVLEERGVLGNVQPETFETAFGYSIRFLDGPTVTDMPPRLFGFHYGFQWRSFLGSDWEYELTFAPGIYSDFEDSAREGLRLQGRGLLRYHHSSDVQFVGGVDYLDRDTTKLLPIAGLIYTPTARTQIELVFPRPAIRQLILTADGKRHWGVLQATYEGDSFAIERLSGEADVVTLEDFKLAMRYETTHLGRKFSYWELGYLLGRRLRYRSGIGNYDPGDTIMLSWGTHY